MPQPGPERAAPENQMRQRRFSACAWNLKTPAPSSVLQRSQVAAGGGAAVGEMGEDGRQARPSGRRINEAWGSMGAVVNAVLRVRSG